MNYDFYKTFIVLAETESFSKTAERLNVVQSTVSNRIQELEKYLHTELFVRTNKSVTLTTSGYNFLPYAERIIKIESEGMERISTSRYKDIIKIGTVHPFYSGYIKQTAFRFMQLYPEVSIDIKIDHTPSLLQMLYDGIIDLAFLCSVPKSDKFHCLNTLKDEIILTAQNSDSFKDAVSIDDIKNLPLLYADTGDSLIEFIEEKLNTRLSYRFSINQVLEILDYVKYGFGYAFVLKSLALNLIQDALIKEVKLNGSDTFKIDGYVVTDKSKIKNENINNFIRLLSDEISSKKDEL